MAAEDLPIQEVLAECKHNRSLLLDRLKSSRDEEPADLDYEELLVVVTFLQEGCTGDLLSAALDTLNFLYDWGSINYKANGKRVRSKDVGGKALIPLLLDLLTSGSCPAGAARRAVTLSLLEFVVHAEDNCQLLTTLGDGKPYLKLLSTLLPTCGDVTLQIDLLEMLFWCARVNALQPMHAKLFNPPSKFYSQLTELAGKPMKDLDLGTELRQLMQTYNMGLGQNASLYSLQATKVVMGNIQDVAASGKFVDFSETHITIGVVLPDEDNHVDESQVEFVDLFYSGMELLQKTDLPGKTVQLDIKLHEVPKSLSNLSAFLDRERLICLTFQRSDIELLYNGDTKIGAALRKVGESTDGTIDLSQSKRKVSIAVATTSKGGTSSMGTLPLSRSKHSNIPTRSNANTMSTCAAEKPGNLDHNGGKKPRQQLKPAIKNTSATPPHDEAGEVAAPAAGALPTAHAADPAAANRAVLPNPGPQTDVPPPQQAAVHEDAEHDLTSGRLTQSGVQTEVLLTPVYHLLTQQKKMWQGWRSRKAGAADKAARGTHKGAKSQEDLFAGPEDGEPEVESPPPKNPPKEEIAQPAPAAKLQPGPPEAEKPAAPVRQTRGAAAGNKAKKPASKKLEVKKILGGKSGSGKPQTAMGRKKPLTPEEDPIEMTGKDDQKPSDHPEDKDQADKHAKPVVGGPLHDCKPAMEAIQPQIKAQDEAEEESPDWLRASQPAARPPQRPLLEAVLEDESGDDMVEVPQHMEDVNKDKSAGAAAITKEPAEGQARHASQRGQHANQRPGAQGLKGERRRGKGAQSAAASEGQPEPSFGASKANQEGSHPAAATAVTSKQPPQGPSMALPATAADGTAEDPFDFDLGADEDAQPTPAVGASDKVDGGGKAACRGRKSDQPIKAGASRKEGGTQGSKPGAAQPRRSPLKGLVGKPAAKPTKRKAEALEESDAKENAVPAEGAAQVVQAKKKPAVKKVPAPKLVAKKPAGKKKCAGPAGKKKTAFAQAARDAPDAMDAAAEEGHEPEVPFKAVCAPGGDTLLRGRSLDLSGELQSLPTDPPLMSTVDHTAAPSPGVNFDQEYFRAVDDFELQEDSSSDDEEEGQQAGCQQAPSGGCSYGSDSEDEGLDAGDCNPCNEALPPDFTCGEDSIKQITKQLPFSMVKQPLGAAHPATAANVPSSLKALSQGGDGPSKGPKGCRKAKDSSAGVAGTAPALSPLLCLSSHLTTRLDAGKPVAGAASGASGLKRKGSSAAGTSKFDSAYCTNGTQTRAGARGKAGAGPDPQPRGGAEAAGIVHERAGTAAAGGAVEGGAAKKQRRGEAASRAAKAGGRGGKKQVAFADEAEESQGGIAIHDIARKMQQLSQHSQGDDSDGEDEGMEQLQVMLKAVVRQKKAQAHKKTLALLQGVKEDFDKEAAQVAAEMQQAEHELTAVCHDRHNALLNQMSNIMQRIDAEVEGMQARVGALWENYRQVYGQVDPLTQELSEQWQQLRQVGQQRVQQLQKAAVAKLGVTSKKIEKLNKRSQKLPELAAILQSFV
ncbi:hypothetical protein N2152v2_003999 [Parachlorella kessleri]